MIDSQKPFIYKVENNKGRLEDYSGGFDTKEQALEWFNKEGKWLENHFNRELILVERQEPINLFTNIIDYVSSNVFN